MFNPHRSRIRSAAIVAIVLLFLSACGAGGRRNRAEDDTNITEESSQASADESASTESPTVEETTEAISTESETVTDPSGPTQSAIQFVPIPAGDGVEAFEMAATEVTNEQYAAFLNEAYEAGLLSFEEPDQLHCTLDDYSTERRVYSVDGLPLISLDGTRVVADHNGNGTFELDEMENPLNRSFIDFDDATETFYIVDPATVDWEQYFDPEIHIGVVDSIDDWAELNDANTGFAEYGDLDLELPTRDEVAQWPANFVRYYGVDAFADFYGYDVPTHDQWAHAARGGQGFTTSTFDGQPAQNGDDGSNPDGITAWYNSSGVGTYPDGHVQQVALTPANPYGLYDMAGNVWEWTKDSYLPNPDMPTHPFTNQGGSYFLDTSLDLTDIRVDQNAPLTCDNQLLGSANGRSHNYPDFPHQITNDPSFPNPFLAEANDHFGFRVVRTSDS